MKPDKYQAPAWETWAFKDDLLADQMEHALGQLVAEAGELLGMAVKAKYKPSYQYSREAELDEWGDWWYYCRVSAYLSGWAVEPWLVVDIRDIKEPGKSYPLFEAAQFLVSQSNLLLEDYLIGFPPMMSSWAN
jgi:hypothetical protein